MLCFYKLEKEKKEFFSFSTTKLEVGKRCFPKLFFSPRKHVSPMFFSSLMNVFDKNDLPLFI
jgi:hypothetical protein